MQSLTRDMANRWLHVCLDNTGTLLPVNAMGPGHFGFSTPPGYPPVVLRNGDTVLDVWITYDIEEVKHGKYFD